MSSIVQGGKQDKASVGSADHIARILGHEAGVKVRCVYSSHPQCMVSKNPTTGEKEYVIGIPGTPGAATSPEILPFLRAYLYHEIGEMTESDWHSRVNFLRKKAEDEWHKFHPGESIQYGVKQDFREMLNGVNDARVDTIQRNKFPGYNSSVTTALEADWRSTEKSMKKAGKVPITPEVTGYLLRHILQGTREWEDVRPVFGDEWGEFMETHVKPVAEAFAPQLLDEDAVIELTRIIYKGITGEDPFLELPPVTEVESGKSDGDGEGTIGDAGELGDDGDDGGGDGWGGDLGSATGSHADMDEDAIAALVEAMEDGQELHRDYNSIFNALKAGYNDAGQGENVNSGYQLTQEEPDMSGLANFKRLGRTGYDSRWEKNRKHLISSTSSAIRAVLRGPTRKPRRNQFAGRLDHQAFSRAIMLNPEVYRSSVRLPGENACLLFVCDASGSMAYGLSKAVAHMVDCMANAVTKIGVNYGLIWYDSQWAWVKRIEEDPRKFDEAWSRGFGGYGGTNAYSPLMFGLEALSRRPESRKLLIHLTDGYSTGYHSHAWNTELRREQDEALSKHGVECLHLMLCHDEQGIQHWNNVLSSGEMIVSPRGAYHPFIPVLSDTGPHLLRHTMKQVITHLRDTLYKNTARATSRALRR
jgi:hypothetical protein